jgi:hypothetical protein
MRRPSVRRMETERQFGYDDEDTDYDLEDEDFDELEAEGDDRED